MDLSLFQEILVIFALSLSVLLLCHWLRLPSIVGFLFTGVLSGPHGLGLVSDIEDVQQLAEIGVVLLLFTVGMEFSIKKIAKYKRFFFGAGTLQVLLFVLVGFGIAKSFGVTNHESLFLGYLFSLSSTAIVMRVLEDRGMLLTPHGRLVSGTLIFQDIAVVPMILSIPLLVGQGGGVDTSFIYVILEGIAILGFVFFAADKVVPVLLYQIARTRSRELFLLAILLICFSIALLVSSIGLSVSLGAFLAGLTVAETEYRNRAIGDILPFKEIFTSFFFVSIGMLLNVGFVVEQPHIILGIATGVVLLKIFLMTGVGLLIGMPLRTSMLAGLALAQIGEFAFVLASSGTQSGIWSELHNQYFLSVSIVTMAVTPSLMELAPRIAELFLKLPLPAKLHSGFSPFEEVSEIQLSNHIIIVGYGLVGRTLGRSCKEAEIPYTAIEIDATIVRQERKKGSLVHYGDATQELTLKHSNIAEAQVLAISINDTLAVIKVIEVARRLNPHLYVVARAHHLEEMKSLFLVGADDVIVDEYGTAIEIFTRVLTKFSVAQEEIEKFIHRMRSEGYDMLRLHHKESAIFSEIKWGSERIEVDTIAISPLSPFAGKTLIELQLRQRFKVSLIAIKRETDSIHHLDGQTRICVNDLLVVMGDPQGIADLKVASQTEVI